MIDRSIRAFPKEYELGVSGSTGMHLRDYFAAQIISGLMIRSWDHIEGDENIIAQWVKSSYYIADLMMEERKKDG